MLFRSCIDMGKGTQSPVFLIDLVPRLPAVGDVEKLYGESQLQLTDSFSGEFLPGTQLTWELTLRRITGGIEISGTITGDVTMECDRCLESFDHQVSIRLRETALWLGPHDEEEGGIEEVDYLVKEDMLDLEPVIRDAIFLSFPASRLCSEDCVGLCSRCGHDLNLGDCGCDRRRLDPRLSGLAALKKKMEEKD